WTPIGCYTDSSTSRTLMAASLVSADNMTVESCLAFCTSGGYSLGGLEFGTQCYCDYALQSSGAPTTPASCTTPCSGNATEQCGGPNAINVYSNGSPSPVAPAQVGSWQYQGCFADSVSSRALPHQMFISGVTIESCTAACKANGFAVAGLEYAGECFCSSSPPTSTHLNDNDCHTACTANTTEFCGGSSKLTVYQDT
ncbi:beta-1,3 exoglucanase precursor-like protein, partial [Roridomyces roridus]